jgi:import receptor subunit TOM20
MVEKKYILGALGLGLVSYAVYFDYKRRTDVEFRKNLIKQRKEAEKLRMSVSAASTSSINATEDTIPTTREGMERYFMEQLSMGENLVQRG